MPTPYDRNQREQNNHFALPNRMSDEAIWDLLSAYADGEATPAEIVQVQALLHQQPSLAGELKFLRHTAEAARTVAEVEPPLHLRSAILAATVQRPTLARRIGMALERWQTVFAPQTSRFALVGGACAAAGLVALLLLPHRPQEPRSIHPWGNPGVAEAVNPLSVVPEGPASSGMNGMNSTHVRVSQATHLAENGAKPTPQTNLSAQTGGQPGAIHAATHADGRVALLALTVDRMIVTHLLTSSPSLTSVHVKSSGTAPSPVIARTKTGVHESDSVARVASYEPSGQFSPVPRMDLANQRALAMTMPKSSDDTLGTNIDGSHDAAPEEPAPAVNTAPDSNGRHIIRVSLSQLPPDARHYPTTADLKREMDARNLGMSRLQINAVERKQCNVALISSRF